jgi:NAD(P)-dependent dehydrogenase (short-subunit alcohol dehydrogenase family)
MASWAVVTGGGTGIGAALARELLSRGMIILIDRRRVRGHERAPSRVLMLRASRVQASTSSPSAGGLGRWQSSAPASTAAARWVRVGTSVHVRHRNASMRVNGLQGNP